MKLLFTDFISIFLYGQQRSHYAAEWMISIIDEGNFAFVLARENGLMSATFNVINALLEEHL